MGQRESPTVADSGPLITFARGGLLSLLAEVAGQILIPPAVRAEVMAREPGATELARAAWLRVQQPLDPARVEHLGLRLDPGESEAIALALEQDAILLVDERRARAAATRLNIPIIGTGGLLVYAKERGLITEVRPLLVKIEASGVHFGQRLIREILRLAGEEP